MPVPLPPQPPLLNLPAQPQDPPMLADVVAARSYQSQINTVVGAQLPNGPTLDDAAQADIYKSTVITAHSAGAAAPAWFQPAMDATLAPIRKMVAKIRNNQLFDGSAADFEIVPFDDGSTPSEAPHNLPPLIDADAIKALTGPQATAYANGYGLGHIAGVPARRKAIGEAVGCTVPI